MRRKMSFYLSFCLVGALALGTVACEKSSSTTPSTKTASAASAKVEKPVPPPPGYKSEAAIKAAILSGKLKLINQNPPLPANVQETANIVYGNAGGNWPLKLDLYEPKGLNKAVPALIFIHGGGWEKGDKKDYRVYNISYAQKGYVTASLDYRLSSEAPYPAAVEDCKCAVRFLRANAAKYHIDPNEMGVVGGSAGGYLVLMLGYTSDVPKLEGNDGTPGVSSKVQAVLDFYGPTDLTTPLARKTPVVLKFMGKPYDGNEDLWHQASPMTYVKPGLPPTLIMHGTIDTTVPIEQSQELANRLRAAGDTVEFHRVVGWPHTMDMAASVNKYAQYTMDQFLAKYLPIK